MINSTFWGWRWCRIAMRMCYSALTVPLHCVDDLSTIQNGWGKSSEWVKWHGWQYQADRDPHFMPNSTFWGWRWICIAMRTCYSAFTMPLHLHCVDDLSTIQDGWRKSSEWVKWHKWQYQDQDVQDPTYMPNSTFWGWRWCRIAMQTCSALTLFGWPQYNSRWVGEEFWVGEMAWMTVPSQPRSHLHAKFHVLGLEMVPYSNANVLRCPYSVLTLCGWPQYYPRWVGEEFWVGEMAWMTVPSRPRSHLHA